jgi:2-amino-4-hydroxy-6-hydroxymethyldihydropteridine diphosphokinase
MERHVFLLLGSNLGERESHLNNAITGIVQNKHLVLQLSSIYETKAWGKTDQPDFLNQVLQIGTNLTPEVLLMELLMLEKRLGRTRNQKWDARIIDIDILLFGSHIVSLPVLKVPHEQLANRRFALMPLNEIAPSFVHPVMHRTVAELLATCPDPLEVILFKRAGNGASLKESLYD